MSQQGPRRPYSNGAFPQIQQAYQNDPRTLLSNSMLASGGATTPTAGGGWAWADGLGRIASALGGGLIGKSQQKKYASQEQELMEALKAAAPSVDYAPPNPAQANPAMVNPAQGSVNAVASALGGSTPPNIGGDPRSMPNPIQSVNPDLEHAAAMAAQPPQGGPQGPQSMYGRGGPARQPMRASYGGSAPPQGQPPFTASANSAPAASSTSQGPDTTTMFRKGIVGQEAVQEADGTYKTSWKGAVGPAQVMPATGPEAAKLAGVPWNRRLFYSKTPEGAEYNLKLGQAYFESQLQRFNGDPLKAAAAYNAGPGAVQRAERKAARRGGAWTDYLPSTTKDGEVVDTTREYVARFANTMGITPEQAGLPANSWESSTTTTTNENIQSAGTQQVRGLPQVPVPEAAQMAQAMPNAPDIPDEVRSSYMTMAQNLMQSDNPFVVAMAQSYLDKGMDEQFQARGKRSDQQFQRDNMGYQTGLNDYADSRSQGRQAQNTERRDAITQNYERENWGVDAQFRANEAGLDREQQARIASADRAVQYDRMEHERNLAKFQNENGRNPFFDTIGGRKLADEMYTEIDGYRNAISKYQQALQILDAGMDTGAIYAGMGAEEIEARMGGTNADVGTFVALSNDTTLGKLGGSLGVAISDGDRSFIRDSNINMGKDTNANRNIARGMIGALKRKEDFLYERMNAEMSGPDALRAFNKDWRAFAESSPIFKTDGKGNVLDVSTTPMTFEQWKASRPKFDAQGNRIN